MTQHSADGHGAEGNNRPAPGMHSAKLDLVLGATYPIKGNKADSVLCVWRRHILRPSQNLAHGTCVFALQEINSNFD